MRVQVSFWGRLVRDASLRLSSDGQLTILSGRVAVNDSRRPVMMVDCVMFAKTEKQAARLDKLHPALSKGRGVFIHGYLNEPRAWTPEGSDVPVAFNQVLVDRIEFTSSRPVQQEEPLQEELF